MVPTAMTTVTAVPRNSVDCGVPRTYRGNEQCLLIAKLGWAIFPADIESRNKRQRKQTNLNH